MFDVLTTIQLYISPKAVVLSVAATQALKYWLPSPVHRRTTDVVPIPWWSRLIPFFPVAFGMLFCFFIERDSSYTTDDVVRGAMSGIFAAYSYRTGKVLFFSGRRRREV